MTTFRNRTSGLRRGILLASATGSLLFALGSAVAEEPAVVTRPAPVEKEDEAVPRESIEQYQSRKRAEARAKFPEWRKKYAYQSLADRLKYEASHRDAPAPRLSDESRKLMAEEENPQMTGWSFSAYGTAFGTIRSESLRLLHTENVEEFVNRDGFGMSRMPRVGPESVEGGGSVEPISPESYPELSATENLVAPIVLPNLTLPESEDDAKSRRPDDTVPAEWLGAANPWLLPPRKDAVEFHQMARNSFLWPSNFGHVKSVNEVAGFESHAFMTLPYAPRDLAKTDKSDVRFQLTRETMWKIARLELVSLLKHDTPRVYMSEHLPKMEELTSAKTRELNAFEQAALDKLVAGEDLESAATPNRIVMLGALRASKNCTQCHNVQHGALLGAFSYDLRRSPPIEVPKAGVTQ